ncbi:MAG: putative DNA-binding domain-containing protein [Proteobacteria bacterium]|nr:putative DNA-binding domain-containing protein [Pseudomonadota bacterium]
MQRPPDSAPDLKALQAAFGRSVRSTTAHTADLQLLAGSDDATAFGQRIDVYRNNAWQFFLAALERTYPVTQRRVGADFFRQLARDYRAQHPSQHGDLHWIGEAFPAWLAGRMAGTGYEWLGDLAHLEWACEASVTAARRDPVGLDALGRFDADVLPHLVLELQPSLRLVTSPFPIWSVWQANQLADAAAPVDLAAGAEHCAVACIADRVAVYRLEAGDHRMLQHLCAGMSLGDAAEAAATDAATLGELLGRLLGWAFGEGLVVQVVKHMDRSSGGRSGSG